MSTRSSPLFLGRNHMYIYVHTNIYIYTYTSKNYIYTYMYICSCVYICTYICIHICIHIYIYIQIHILIYIYINMYIYKNMYTYIYHTHTHTHTHNCLADIHGCLLLYMCNTCVPRSWGGHVAMRCTASIVGLFSGYTRQYIYTRQQSLLYILYLFRNTQGFVALCIYLFRIYTCNTCVLRGWGA